MEWAAHKSVVWEAAAVAVSLAESPSVVESAAEVATGVVKSEQRNGMTVTGVVVVECAMLARKKPKHR